MPSSPYVLYGMRLSYFTRKLEAALGFYGVPFEYRPKTLSWKDEVERRAGTNQIPVLCTPENWMVPDTTPILDLLDGRYPHRRLFPEGPRGVLVHVLEEYLDEWTPRVAIHYRWQYPEGAEWAAREMGEELVPEGDAIAKMAIGSGIAAWGARACRATGVSEEGARRTAEEELARILEALEAQLGESRWALGDRPTAVDAVLLGALRGHFLVDPVPSERFSKLERVRAFAERVDVFEEGEICDFETPTPFARTLLAELGGPYKHFVLGNARALEIDEKSFIASVYGEDVSFRTRAYPERSRRMIAERIAHRLRPSEQEEVRHGLKAYGLEDVFWPPELA